MNLAEYRNLILGTSRDDWQIMELQPGRVTDSHGMQATLKSDLSISIAWGYIINQDFKEGWANKFSDPQASSHLVEFFYNGVLVFRDTYVNVDGYRCCIPLPKRDVNQDTGEILRQFIPSDQHQFFSLFNTFETVSQFDRYFASINTEIEDIPWME